MTMPASLSLDTLDTLTTAVHDVAVEVHRLRVECGALRCERAHIVEVLTAFYRSDISISTLQPLLDLCVELGAVTKPEPR